MVRKFFVRFRKDETGAAMVEYAIALLVAAGLGVGTFTYMGSVAGINSTAACNALTNSGSIGTGTC